MRTDSHHARKTAQGSTGVWSLDAIDWTGFLRRCDMVWDRLPDSWDNAPFVGDGRLGAMLWQRPDGRLHIEVSRSDLYDHRRIGGGHTVLYSKCRLPNGAFSLRFGQIDQPCHGRLRLDLWNAEVRGDIRCGDVEWKIRLYAHATENVLVLDVGGPSDAKPPALEWHAQEARSTRNPWQTPTDYHPYPPANRESIDGIELSVQSMPQDPMFRTDGAGEGQHATAWSVRQIAPGQWRCIVTVSVSHPGTTAATDACDRVRRVQQAHDASLEERHRDWWHAFYPKSFLSVPDGEVERFYWIQIYKMGSASRKGGPIIDLMGPWFRDTGWPAIWWNLNIQLTYWPFYMSNHLDEAEPLAETLWRGRAVLAKNAAPYEADSFAIGRASAPDCESSVGVEVGNLPWVMHNLWMHYRSTVDDHFLAERLYPLMKGSFRYLRHVAVRRDDGSLGLPATASPEYTDAVDDCSYTLACFRWLAGVIIVAAKRLGFDDPIVEECRNVLKTLVPYPIDPATGVMVGKDMPFAESHRHWSHLFMIYPFREWDWHDPHQRVLIDQSVKTWTSRPEKFAGYSWLGAASMSASAGDGNGALAYLRTFLQSAPLPNTFYREGSPVIETPLACARVIQELLLESYRGVIHVFPAVPDTWSDAEFANFRVEGAFLVSARRRGGVTEHVSVTSLAGEPCRISTNIIGQIATLESVDFHQIEDGVVDVTLSRGQTVTFHSKDHVLSAIPIPAPVSRSSDCVPWGGR